MLFGCERCIGLWPPQRPIGLPRLSAQPIAMTENWSRLRSRRIKVFPFKSPCLWSRPSGSSNFYSGRFCGLPSKLTGFGRLGHSQIQIRTEGVKDGQYRADDANSQRTVLLPLCYPTAYNQTVRNETRTTDRRGAVSLARRYALRQRCTDCRAWPEVVRKRAALSEC